tara:strand:+ start:715 stop:924 length:210 start_codon:yes stop_codon:yes gene_type:complete
MKFLKVHRAIIDETEIEAVEWNPVNNELPDDSDKSLFQIQFHMRSGKKFTRRVYESQLNDILDTLEMRE